MKSEVWKPISGYEGYYEVSNLGRIRSVTRYVNSIVGKKVCRGHIISSINNGNGYRYVTLNKQHKRKNLYVHRLVAEAFCEKQPGKDFVNHIDYDKTNNSFTNLEWVTQKENVHHSVEHLKKRKSKTVSNTGERYISYRKTNKRYRVTIDKKELGSFQTLDEAILFRNEYLKGVI